MWPQPLKCVAKASLQVVVKSRLGARLVVVGHWLVQNAFVAGFLQIGGNADDKPKWIVVETTTNVVVAALSKRLVLVIGATAHKLRRGQVQDALASAQRRQDRKSTRLNSSHLGIS